MQKLTKYIVTAAILFSSMKSFAVIETYVYDQALYKEEAVPEIFSREHLYSANHTIVIHNHLKEGKVVVHNKDNANLETLFIKWQLEPGDRIFVNSAEAKDFQLTIDNTPKNDKFLWLKSLFKTYATTRTATLYPCILVTAKANDKEYGFVTKETLDQLSKVHTKKNVPLDQIISFNTNPELTVLYAILPKDRSKPGKMMIKHKGEWVNDKEGKRLVFPILGRSKNNIDSQTNYRMYFRTDTPQGIYNVNGVMKHSDKTKFGTHAYLNIDDIRPSPGRFRYPYDKLLVRSLLPLGAQNEYWAHEFNLAQALGRYYFRVYSNDPKQIREYLTNTSDSGNVQDLILPTTGGLNMGDSLHAFMDTLHHLGVINMEDFTDNIKVEDGNELLSNVTERIGLVYLIVKDED